jgi:hypothetical protein
MDWYRIKRTFVQVFGGTLAAIAIAFLLDYGADGQVVVRDYIFGQGGLIVLCTTALAAWMNRPTNRV